MVVAESCKTSSGETADGPVDAGVDSATSEAATPDGGGTGTVSGSADGTPFTTVATSYVIGAPDSAETTVVFLFSKPVRCSDLGTPGWDQKITDGTQLLEMKIFGKAPGTFKAVTTVTPAPGEASVNYTLSATSSTPAESGSSGGSVTLTGIAASASAQGSFSIAFGTNKLDGTFDAIFCPGGHEP